jgi:hypothetical protein
MSDKNTRYRATHLEARRAEDRGRYHRPERRMAQLSAQRLRRLRAAISRKREELGL